MEGKIRIIVVEDEAAISKLISYVLQNAGFMVEAYTDGGEALEAITKNPPNLILLDLMLPTMSGFEILTKLKQDENFKKIPVVVLTCRGQDEDKEKAFKLGVSEYMTKPFSPTGLVAILGDVMSREKMST
jgi:DNA-binding response OmpR family regulator